MESLRSASLAFFFFSLLLASTSARSIKEGRVPPPPGGQKIVNVTDPKVIGAAEWAVDSINEQRGYSETALRLSLIKIDNGTQQVVDGEMYKLIIHLGQSECLNIITNIGKTERECPPLMPYPIVYCEVDVLARNWSMSNSYFYHLMNSSCGEPPIADNMLASREDKGVTNIDVADLKVRHAADMVLNELNRVRGYSCCTYRDSVDAIISAKYANTQYGVVYDLVLRIGESFCTNNILNKSATSDRCPIQPGTMLRTCSVRVALTNDDQHLQALVDHNCARPKTTDAPVVG